jgi:hypothetical protein
MFIIIFFRISSSVRGMMRAPGWRSCHRRHGAKPTITSISTPRVHVRDYARARSLGTPEGLSPRHKAEKTEYREPVVRVAAVTPHSAANGAVSKHGVVRKTAVDGRTTRHAGYGSAKSCASGSRRCSAGSRHAALALGAAATATVCLANGGAGEDQPGYRQLGHAEGRPALRGLR